MTASTKRRPVDCPCGGAAPNQRDSDKPPRFVKCCGRFIDGGAVAPTALELMRSRYSAYALGESQYLRDTWATQTCPADLDVGIDAPDAPRWLGLQIKRHTPLDDTHAEVEFIARYKVGGRAHRLHESSRFIKGEDGCWRYVDGDVSDR
jgi:SEC-C motif-containing protein